MSFNANTLYKAVDIDEISNQCKAAIADKKVYVIQHHSGDIHECFMDHKRALQRLNQLNKESWDYFLSCHKVQ